MGEAETPALCSALSRVAALKGHLCLRPSAVNGITQHGYDHPTAVIRRERQSPSFNVRRMKSLLFGGEENIKLLERATDFIIKDPILFDKESPHDLSLPEHRERYPSH